MGEIARILVVDDEMALTGIISQILCDYGYIVDTAATGEEALVLFGKNTYHLVISDIRMPGMSGLDLLKEVKKLNPETQVVIMTSYASMETAIDALRNGAYDYVVKPFEDIDMIRNIAKHALEKMSLELEKRTLIRDLRKTNEELKRVNDALKELALKDGLTGLHNHRSFQETLKHEVERARRYNHPLSLILIDIDHFKQYNDTFGHPEGDALLKEFGQLLLSHMRSSDFVARYGGEEFVILLPEMAKGEGHLAADKIRRCIEEHPFPNRNTTVSMGLSTYPEDGLEGACLVKEADTALYEAKHNGRNRVCLANGEKGAAK